MEAKSTPVSQLYYNYKSTSDDGIANLLQKITIVKLLPDVSGKTDFYPLNKEAVNKMLDNPRGYAFLFQSDNTQPEPLLNLRFYKKFDFLVKSSSRFFLKADIGEVIDQIPLEDQWNVDVKAICVEPYSYGDSLPGTQGEHFIMSAILFK